MKKIFFAHPDIILGAIAFVLLGILLGFFSWSINTIFFEIYRSNAPIPAGAQKGFDLQSAQTLDMHGVSTSTVSTSVPIIIATTTATSS